eukprot:8719883-Alexandrium_andersonii.AAC.1
MASLSGPPMRALRAVRSWSSPMHVDALRAPQLVHGSARAATRKGALRARKWGVRANGPTACHPWLPGASHK